MPTCYDATCSSNMGKTMQEKKYANGTKYPGWVVWTILAMAASGMYVGGKFGYELVMALTRN